MTTFEPGTTSDLDHLEVVEDDIAQHAGCVVCGVEQDEPGCCSLRCVREARRELDLNLSRLRSLQGAYDSPAATRARLTERNGQLTAALMVWRR